MNKKPTILAVAALGSLALIGTGFAGWVIAANAETSADGTITAYTVTDNRLVIAEGAAWDDSSIRFGEPEQKDAFEAPWFTFATETNGTEKLAATYTVHVDSKNENDTGKIKVAPSVGVVEAETGDPNADSINAAKSAWDEAVKNGLVLAPTYEVKIGEKAADLVNGDAIAKGGLTYTVKVQFAWGDHFKKDGASAAVNPYNYYNSFTVKDKGDDAFNTLSALYKISSARFVLNLTFARA